MLVTAGFYKAFPLFDRLPDLTVVCDGITMAAIFVAVLTIGIPRSGRFAQYVAYFAIMGLGAVQVTAGYSASETARFFLITMVAGLAPFFVLGRHNDRALGYVFTFMLLLGLAFTVVSLVFPSAASLYGRVAVATTNTIGTARVIGAAIIIVVAYALGRKVGLIIAGGATALLVYGLFSTGSRGPVLGVGIAVVLMLLPTPAVARHFGRGSAGRRLLLGAALLAFGIYSYVGAPQYSRARLFSIGTSGGVRIDVWFLTLHQIAIHPLGVGWGNWSTLPSIYLAAPNLTYPHDIVLQAFSEGGWLPGLATVALIVGCIIAAWHRATDHIGLGVLGLFVFWTINAMVSGDLNDNRLMFFGAGVVLARTAYMHRRERTHSEPALA